MELQKVFDPAEQLLGEGHFGRAMHFRFDDVHAASAGVTPALQVMHGDQAGDDAVENPFGNFQALVIEDRGVGHQVPDVANKQQRAPGQRQRRAVGAGVFAVGVEASGDGFAVFDQVFFKVALHQAQPVAIDLHLVVCVDRRYRVFTVDDGRECGLHQQVFDPCGVRLADDAVAVDLDFNVQVIVLEHNGRRLGGRTLITKVLGGVGQTALAAIFEADQQGSAFNLVARGIHVRALLQRERLIQKRPGKRNHFGPTQRVVGAARFSAAVIGDHVGAIERVVQRTPAGIGRIQGVARIGGRHHQLWTGLCADFAVDVGRVDLDLLRLRLQVANAAEEVAVRRHVGDRAGMRAVPGVEFALQAITLGQQGAVDRCQFVHQPGETAPERLCIQPGARQHVVFNEVVQHGCNLEAVAVNKIAHCYLSFSSVYLRLCAPALATCASCTEVTPDTPMAPMTWPSTMIGTPPSREVSNGADKNAWRPPLTMSS